MEKGRVREFSPSDHLTPLFLAYFAPKAGMSVIDFGCGTGRSVFPLKKAGLQVHLVDFCENCLDILVFLETARENSSAIFHQQCLWNLSLEPADWAICFDVLEHIPEEKIDAVLQGIAKRMRRGGLLNIALYEDSFGQLINEKLHLTLKPVSWWEEKLQRYFVVETTKILGESNLLVFVRCKTEAKKLSSPR